MTPRDKASEEHMPYTVRQGWLCEMCDGSGTAHGLYTKEGIPIPPDKCPLCNGEGQFVAVVLPEAEARSLLADRKRLESVEKDRDHWYINHEILTEEVSTLRKRLAAFEEAAKHFFFGYEMWGSAMYSEDIDRVAKLLRAALEGK